MKLEEIFTTDELNSIDAGTYDITNGILAAKLDLYAAIVRAEALEEAAKVCEEEAKAWARLNAQDEEGYGAIQCAAAIRGLK